MLGQGVGDERGVLVQFVVLNPPCTQINEVAKLSVVFLYREQAMQSD